ncbi:hypothetical protein Cni_G16217 [Canna indica]|uniref:MENTAL domain-containing protein n=1 Tax=Canna indica TaxID=4628 RepID=A0AAQ3QCD7_9LILI|nr:hypothetical protein Cni_G16217 [Canna indica]
MLNYFNPNLFQQWPSLLLPPLASLGKVEGMLLTVEKKMALATGSPRARPWSQPLRWAKTLFFLAAMLASLLLVCAPPLFVVVLDLLLPPALLSVSSPISPWTFFVHLKGFDFSSSLIDLPMVSIVRSLLILCAFLLCDGGRGLYLGITGLCSCASIVYVLVKFLSMNLAASTRGEPRRILTVAGKEAPPAIEGLFVASVALAIAHVVVAYRTCCRERRKLLVYRIDVEAVKVKGGLIKEDSKL